MESTTQALAESETWSSPAGWIDPMDKLHPLEGGEVHLQWVIRNLIPKEKRKQQFSPDELMAMLDRMYRDGWIRQGDTYAYECSVKSKHRVVDWVIEHYPKHREIDIDLHDDFGGVRSVTINVEDYLGITNEAVQGEAVSEGYVLYHGAQRWLGTAMIMAHRRGHAEHGPGIYLTTSWETARKYSKGGGAVHRVVLSRDLRWVQDVRLDFDKTLQWLSSLPGLRDRAGMVESWTNLASRSGKPTPAEFLVNIFVNSDQASGRHGPALAQWLVANGVDASKVSMGNEDWVVVFNPEKILKVDRLTPKDVDAPGFAFETPRLPRPEKSDGSGDGESTHIGD